MHPEPNTTAPVSPAHLIGMVAAGLDAEVTSIESRGVGIVACLELDGATYRVQVDQLGTPGR